MNDTRIWCPTCGGPRPATKMFGPLPGAVGQRREQTTRWWNVCRRCGGHFAALAPGATGARSRRRVQRRGGQLPLFKEAA